VITFVIPVKEMSNIAKLFGGVLERFNLLPQLCLLGLLLPQYFVDISHVRLLLWAL
jgi:hypothetical protein